MRSYDFDNGLDLTKVLESYATMGFQATNMSAAIDEINRMVGPCWGVRELRTHAVGSCTGD